MHNGLNALTRRILGVVAIALALAANTASADFLFGLSNTVNKVNSLSLNDSSITLFSGANQGWWSKTGFSFGPSYTVGLLDNGKNEFQVNNFFIFDISGLDAPVTSAELVLAFNIPWSLSATSLTYHLFDVSSNLDDVNDNDTDPLDLIFKDLGFGTSYGLFSVPFDPADDLLDDNLKFLTVLDGDEQVLALSLTLNSAALADLNAAIARGDEQFAIGGTLKPESVPDSGNTLVLFGLAAAGVWSLRKRKQAA